jgi:hypothetical protein
MQDEVQEGDRVLKTFKTQEEAIRKAVCMARTATPVMWRGATDPTASS